MKIYTLSDITLVSSNVAGSTYDEYASGTTYATGNNVKVSFESDGVTPIFPVLEYESLADANQGNYPPDSPAKWSEIGAENRCKMFDAYLNTQTANTDDIEVVVNANNVNAVGLFGLYGASVTLKLVRNTVTLKEETIDLRIFVPQTGWYAWLYQSSVYGISKLIWEFGKHATGTTLEITITARSGAAACGIVALGNGKGLGTTVYSPQTGIDDYSVTAEDALGRTYLSQGNYADRAEIDMWVPNADHDYVRQQLVDARGIASMYDLNNSGTAYQSLQIYGYPQSFSIIIPGAIRSKCALEIKGLV